MRRRVREKETSVRPLQRAPRRERVTFTGSPAEVVACGAERAHTAAEAGRDQETEWRGGARAEHWRVPRQDGYF